MEVTRFVLLILAIITPAAGTAATGLKCSSIVNVVDSRRYPILEEGDEQKIKAEIEKVNRMLARQMDTPARVEVQIGLSQNSACAVTGDEFCEYIFYDLQSTESRCSKRENVSAYWPIEMQLASLIHEYGHSVFSANFRKLLRAKDYWPENIEDMLEGSRLEPYQELFADLLAVLHLGKLTAMSDVLKLKARGAEELADAKNRDFSRKIRVAGWAQEESHVALSPVRSFLGEKYLLNPSVTTNPGRFAKLVFQVLVAEYLEAPDFSTLEQTNQRLVDALDAVLEPVFISPGSR